MNYYANRFVSDLNPISHEVLIDGEEAIIRGWVDKSGLCIDRFLQDHLALNKMFAGRHLITERLKKDDEGFVHVQFTGFYSARKAMNYEAKAKSKFEDLPYISHEYIFGEYEFYVAPGFIASGGKSRFENKNSAA